MRYFLIPIFVILGYLLFYVISIPFGIFLTYIFNFDLKNGYHKSVINNCISNPSQFKCFKFCEIDSSKSLFGNCAAFGMIWLIFLIIIIWGIVYIVIRIRNRKRNY